MVLKRRVIWTLIGVCIVGYFKNDAANNTFGTIATNVSPNTTSYITTPAGPLVVVRNMSCENNNDDNFIYFTVSVSTRNLDPLKIKMVYARIPFDQPAEDPEPFKECLYKTDKSITLLTCKTFRVLDYEYYQLNLTYGVYSVPLMEHLLCPVDYFEHCRIDADLNLKVHNTTETSIVLIGDLTRLLTVMMYGMVVTVYDDLSKISSGDCHLMNTLENFSCVIKHLVICRKYKLCVSIQLTLTFTTTSCTYVKTKGCKKNSQRMSNFHHSRKLAIILIAVSVPLAVIVGFFIWWKKPCRSYFLKQNQDAKEEKNKVVKYSRFENSIFMVDPYITY